MSKPPTTDELIKQGRIVKRQANVDMKIPTTHENLIILMTERLEFMQSDNRNQRQEINRLKNE